MMLTNTRRSERKDDYEYTITDKATVRAQWFAGKGLTSVSISGPRSLECARVIHAWLTGTSTVRVLGYMGKRARVYGPMHLWHDNTYRVLGYMGKRARVYGPMHLWHDNTYRVEVWCARRFGTFTRLEQALRMTGLLESVRELPF